MVRVGNKELKSRKRYEETRGRHGKMDKEER
jgi:hypothetical protein